MLVGYVSDERYVALADVLVEFERDGESVAVVAVHAARRGLRRPARRAATASRSPRTGFGAKRVDDRRSTRRSRTSSACSPTACSATPGRSGCARGERSEFRVHAVEPYQLTLWRYGLRAGVRPHPRLVRRARPARDDADHARRRLHPDRRQLEQARLRQPAPHPVRRPAPSARGLYYFHAKTRVGRASSRSPGSSPRRSRRRRIAVLASTITWNAYNNFGGRSNYINADRAAADADRQRPPRADALHRRRVLQRLGAPDEAYAPLSFDRPEPLNHVAASRRRSPTRSRAGQPCHLAPAEWRLLGLAGARGLRLRPLRRDAAARRHARPRRLPRC